MKTKTLLQAIGILAVIMMTIGNYILWTAPMLQFATDGKDNTMTQVFVFIIRVMAWGVLIWSAWGILYAYQFKLSKLLATMLVGLWFLLQGISMKMACHFHGATAAYHLLPTIFCFLSAINYKRFQLTVSNFQKKFENDDASASNRQ